MKLAQNLNLLISNGYVHFYTNENVTRLAVIVHADLQQEIIGSLHVIGVSKQIFHNSKQYKLTNYIYPLTKKKLSQFPQSVDY